eukprot:12769105-Alexandrium_andersonii.AAC.1
MKRPWHAGARGQVNLQGAATQGPLQAVVSGQSGIGADAMWSLEAGLLGGGKVQDRRESLGHLSGARALGHQGRHAWGVGPVALDALNRGDIEEVPN